MKIEFFDKNVRHFFYNLVDETVRVREEKNIVRPDLIHLLLQVRKGNLELESESEVIETGFSTAKEVFKGISLSFLSYNLLNHV